MKAFRYYLFFLLFFSPAKQFWLNFPSYVHLEQINFTNACLDWITQLTQNEDWDEQLIDPILSTAEQFSEKYQLYSHVHDCLATISTPLSDLNRKILTLIDFFLIFVNAPEPTGDQLSYLTIDPLKSTDKAIVQLRDETGVSPPPGYIYVRLFPSQEAMPAPLKVFFVNKDIKGLTLFVRYVAVLAENKNYWGERLLQSFTLPETISHELVHAYVNARLGYKSYAKIPTWYAEGIAIYFSGSGKDHTVVTPNLTITTTSPLDYQQYENNFNFLEATYGRKQLLTLIKESIDKDDPSILYTTLDFLSAQDFIGSADAWKKQSDLHRLVFVFTLIILIGIGMTIWWKHYPDAWCVNCDFGGKWIEFTDGICPRCHQPYNIRVDNP